MSLRTKIKEKMKSIAPGQGISDEFWGGRHVTSYAGSPDGVLTGKVGELCLDSVNNDVWLCTTGSTVWVKIFD
jgi:hypothetical protein